MTRRVGLLAASVLIASAAFVPVGAIGVEGSPARWPVCGRWIQVNTPLVGEQTELSDVVVISPTEAWAVGAAQVNHRRFALVLRWDGWRWSRVPTPELPGSSELQSLAVADDGTAWAVGTRSDGDLSRALIERWDGDRWSLVRSPLVWRAGLMAVATVPGTRTAWVVGSLDRGEGRGLAIRWNGTAWRTTHVPDTAGWLQDVTMRGRVPWAVGVQPDLAHAFSMRWGSSGWRAIETPRAQGVFVATAAQPDGDLWAVSYDAIYRRTDGRWRTVRLLPGGASALDVTFPSPVDGWVVGGRSPANPNAEWQLPFSMRRHGSTWVRVPVPSDGLASTLTAVDGTPHDVWAVGYPAGYEGAAAAFHYC